MTLPAWTRDRRGTTAAYLGVVLVYAVLARWLTSDDAWSVALLRPPFQPPDWVFGAAWSLNFLALGVAGVALARADAVRARRPLMILVVSAAFSLSWAALFHGPHALWWASAAITVAALLTWALVIEAARVVAWAGALLTPYALWLTFAVSLSFWYADHL